MASPKKMSNPPALDRVREGLACATVAPMDFNELVALLRNPGDDGLPETIYDDLTSSYNLAVEGGAASLSASEAEVASLREEVSRLKALNFDLLMAAGGEKSDDEPTDEPTDPIGETSIDDLFDKD